MLKEHAKQLCIFRTLPRAFSAYAQETLHGSGNKVNIINRSLSGRGLYDISRNVDNILSCRLARVPSGAGGRDGRPRGGGEAGVQGGLQPPGLLHLAPGRGEGRDR